MELKPDPIFTELKAILDSRDIRTVFQPIVCLKTGSIFGFEALSRGPSGSALESPVELFAAAEKYNLLFALEKLCREKALTNAKGIMDGYKIFINVNPYVIFDPEFKDGATKKIISDLGISQNDIVIELAEKSSIQDFRSFRIALEHYEEQGFNIAIDDTGAGYSGLQTIVSLNYKYIKIDRSLIENIDKDLVKRALLEVFVKFSKKISATVIAEGIETPGELETIIDLGVDYVQGYLIARPSEVCPKELPISNFILHKNRRKRHYTQSPYIAEIAQRGIVISPETITSSVVRMFEELSDLHSLIVLSDTKPVGLVVRERLYSRLATQYGYAVFMGRPIKAIMDEKPMIVDFFDTVENVSQRAMIRDISKLYNCIIVVKDNEYFGVVSIRNLLDKLANLQIEHAKNLNPLTSLPGNPIIEKVITERLASNKLFSVLYIDLNNFKPYNDCYGYKKGDEVLLFTADLLKKSVDEWGTSEDFLGHIGGDDFLLVTTPEKDKLISENIIKRFDSQISRFYLEKHWQRGYVTARDRQGTISRRPLLSIAIAIVSNENKKFENALHVSELASELKEHVKSQEKSAYLKDRRKG